MRHAKRGNTCKRDVMPDDGNIRGALLRRICPRLKTWGGICRMREEGNPASSPWMPSGFGARLKEGAWAKTFEVGIVLPPGLGHGPRDPKGVGGRGPRRLSDGLGRPTVD